jgi:excisionase family DNA binding protein
VSAAASWIPDQPFFTVAEVATLLDVAKTTVLDWIKADKLVAVRLSASTSGRGAIRIPRAELERFLVERSNVQPSEQPRLRAVT